MDRTATDRFMDVLRRAVQDGSFALLRVRPAAGPGLEVRLVALKAGPALSLASQQGRQTLTQSRSVEEGLKEISSALSGGGSAWLETAAKNLQLVAPPVGRSRLVEHRAADRPRPDRGHDRVKRRHLEGGTDWLGELGLVDERGTPRPGMRDKLRQIERYADLLSHFAADCAWKENDRITLADMGCGKGYLTFAAWHLLHRKLRLEATILGVDAQPALVEFCSALAAKLRAGRLSFRTGRIESAELPPLDALIALHACNDATDAAIRRGVQAGARLIVVAPCCHKDVRAALGAPGPLVPVLAHGIFKERFAEWLTDGLRVLALEAAGYRVKTAEFVAAEHTPKNLLIAAIRGNSGARRAAAAAQLAEIKAWAGLGPLPIDAILASDEQAQA